MTWREYCFGVYYYMDLFNNEIVYVGRDSHIDIQRRHKSHLKPSEYDTQPFNRALQNNPARYKYYTYKICDSFVEMNELERNLINLYRPRFNYKLGFDETPLKGYTYNVIKDGHYENGKQRYGIYGKKSKRLISSYDLEFIEDVSSKLKSGELKEFQVKELRKTTYSICKNGFTNQGKQTYAINKDHKIFIGSVNKEFLEFLCEKLNNGDITEDYVTNTHSRTIMKELYS